MKLASTLALALCVALSAPIAATASDGVTAIQKHRVHMHQIVRGSFNPAATALAPVFAKPLRQSGLPSAEGYFGANTGFSWEPYGW